MSTIDDLRVILTETKNELTVCFTGESSLADIDMFLLAIDGPLKSDRKLNKVFFDMSKIDLIANAAGRILDLACHCREIYKREVEVRMPSDIYEVLREIEPKLMPKPVKNRVKTRGVTIVMAPPLSANAMRLAGAVKSKPEFPIELLACSGKVRSVSEQQVTVSLFTGDQEIIGEFNRYQFVGTEVKPGTMFEYLAEISKQGETVVSLYCWPEQYPTNEELEEDADAILKEYEIDTNQI